MFCTLSIDVSAGVRQEFTQTDIPKIRGVHECGVFVIIPDIGVGVVIQKLLDGCEVLFVDRPDQSWLSGFLFLFFGGPARFQHRAQQRIHAVHLHQRQLVLKSAC